MFSYGHGFEAANSEASLIPISHFLRRGYVFLWTRGFEAADTEASLIPSSQF
jgi:hypothetical protein